jgi:3D (Asp-Asp-Asp) domain-containing protein
MNPKFSWKEIVFTTFIGGFLIGLVIWQGQTKLNERNRELQESKQEVKETVGKLVDALEETLKWETVKMKVTAYCPCKKCCEQWADIPVSSGKRKTASGHTIKVGDKFVAAPRSYPFGTEMVIDGYAGGNVVKVEDVGGAIKNNKLDLYFDSHKTALIWGVRYVDVKVKVRG